MSIDKLSPEEKWQLIRQFYTDSPLKKQHISALAELVELNWYVKRNEDTAAHFVDKTWSELNKQQNFGKTKISKLVDILFLAIDAKLPSPSKECSESLNIDEWNKFPLSLSNCSARTLQFFKNAEITTPSDLTSWVQLNGISKIKTYKNAGNHVKDEVTLIYDGWSLNDPTKFDKLLPISEDLRFSIERCMALYLGGLSESKRRVLKLRFIDKKTHEICGESISCTRSRAQQIEQEVFNKIESALDYFKPEAEDLYQKWMTSSPLELESINELLDPAVICYFEHSKEGKKALSDEDEIIGNIISEITREWGFYCGSSYSLEDSHAAQNYADLLDKILIEGVIRGTWEKVEGSYIRHKTKLLKPAALAHLLSVENYASTGVEWLENLKSCKLFNNLSTIQLQRLYNNWKKDPRFQGYAINFSNTHGQKNELLSELDTSEAENEVKDHATEDRLALIAKFAKNGPPPKTNKEAPSQPTTAVSAVPADDTILEANQQILDKIQEAQELTNDEVLLGLLPVTKEEQKEFLDLFKQKIKSEQALCSFLVQYPAYTSYCLTIATAEGLANENIANNSFYSAWQAPLGFVPQNFKRQLIAKSYALALQKTGLKIGTVEPDKELSYHGGCYLYHAAVLPHFANVLNSALEHLLQERQLPSTDADDEIDAFRTQLHKVLPKNSAQRLSKVIKSDAGLILVKRLCQWEQFEDENLFPPFIADMLRAQQYSGSGRTPKKPYLTFNEYTSELEIILPQQPKEIVNRESYWKVDGINHSYPARTTNDPVCVAKLSSSVINICLSRLSIKGSNNQTVELPDRNHEIDCSITEQLPLRVFNIQDSKEIALNLNLDLIEIRKPGVYTALIHKSVQIKSNHTCEATCVSEDVYQISFECHLNGEPLILCNDNGDWTIQALVTPGIYFQRGPDSGDLQATETLTNKSITITYGTDLTLFAAFPAHVSSATVEFCSSWQGDQSKEIEIAIPSAQEDTKQVQFLDLSNQFSDWLKGLGAAIHPISISLSYGKQKFTESKWLWMGLQYTSTSGGFHCSTLPQNVCQTGYTKTHSNNWIRDTDSIVAPTFTVKKTPSDNDQLSWKMPSSSVFVYLIADDESKTLVQASSPVNILPTDRNPENGKTHRRIHFEYGGLGSVTIQSGDRKITTLDGTRRILLKDLYPLSKEFPSGQFDALITDQHGHTTNSPILNLRTPHMAQSCLYGESEIIDWQCWQIRGIARDGINGLRLRLYDLEAELENRSAGETHPSVGETHPIELPIEEESTLSTTELVNGLAVHLNLNSDNGFDLHFRHDHERSKGLIYAIELESQNTETLRWQTVSCQDNNPVQLSNLRIIFRGTAPDNPSEVSAFKQLFWDQPSKIKYGANVNFSDNDRQRCKEWTSWARWVVNYSYPERVFEKHNFHFKAIYQAVTQLCRTANDWNSWWKNAIDGLIQHSNRTVNEQIPILLYGCSFQKTYPPLNAVASIPCSLTESHIAKAYLEAHKFINSGHNHYQYLGETYLDGRVDPAFFHLYGNFNAVASQQNTPLQEFDIVGWSNQLNTEIRHAEFTNTLSTFPLLSSKHFLYCTEQLCRRIQPWLRIIDQNLDDQQDPHWAASYLANIAKIAEKTKIFMANQSAQLRGEVLWTPYLNSELMLFEPQKKEMVFNFMRVTSALSLLHASVCCGRISTEEAGSTFNHITGYDLDNYNTAENLLLLCIGTAPELAAYYFLFFTFILRHEKALN